MINFKFVWYYKQNLETFHYLSFIELDKLKISLIQFETILWKKNVGCYGTWPKDHIEILIHIQYIYSCESSSLFRGNSKIRFDYKPSDRYTVFQNNFFRLGSYFDETTGFQSKQFLCLQKKKKKSNCAAKLNLHKILF